MSASYAKRVAQWSPPAMAPTCPVGWPKVFWLGRYGERLDARARLLREALLRLMEYDQDGSRINC